MTTFKLNIAAIIFAIFALTSCQKDNLNELQTTAKTATTTLSKSNRNIPAAGIHIVNEAVKTQASKAAYEKQAQSRSKALYGVECGTTFTKTTEGEGNSLDATKYPKCLTDAARDPFDGEDMIFHFVVEETPDAIMQHDITIKDLGADLDLFVFSLDRFGFINECKALSITIGYDAETVSMRDLSPGCYIIMVDGYAAGVAGEFTFEMNCSAVSANPPSITEISVNKVSVGYDGEVTGVFQQLTTTDWKEIGVDSATFDFTEVARDEWNVYLRDESRGVNIQLDLNRKMVVYSDDAGSNFDLYEIIDSSDKMNGYLATTITFQTADGFIGNYTNYDLEGKAWIETSNNPDGNNFEFTEVARDEWSVYLRDDSRGVNIQLDMNRAMVVYSDDAGNTFDLYEITEAK